MPVSAATIGEGVEGTHNYEYDALGRRSAMVVNDTEMGTSTRTIFVCMTYPLQENHYSGQVVAEYESINGSGWNMARKYGYGADIDEPLTLTSVESGVETGHFYHANRILCVAGLTDSSAEVVQRYGYMPYGEVATLGSDGSDQGTGRGCLWFRRSSRDENPPG